MENLFDFFETETATMFANEQTEFFEQTFDVPGGGDDDDDEEEDNNNDDKSNSTDSDNPPIDDEVVHSPLPTQTGGKPR